MNPYQNLKKANQLTQANDIMAKITPLHRNIILVNMEKGSRKTVGGVILADDNGKDEGIRPRWAQVYSVGPENNDVQAGQWVLMQHGRWTTECHWVDPETKDTFKYWLGDPDGILGVQSEVPPGVTPTFTME